LNSFDEFFSFQASGEAKYLSDRLPETGDLYCNVVLAEVGNADIDTIDVTEAEKIPGCVAIITSNKEVTFVNQVCFCWQDCPWQIYWHLQFSISLEKL